MSGHIIVHFCKVLVEMYSAKALYISERSSLTDTKKLEVPSARSNVSGNSFNHVSSPYMTILPVPFAFICASHVSCVASVEEVSDSAKLRIKSMNDGVEPVVMALIRGIVIVGEVAWAVNGMASPLAMRLRVGISFGMVLRVGMLASE